MTRVTISKDLLNKFDKLEEIAGDKLEEKLSSIAKFGIQISPIDTGAYVESFAIYPRGSRQSRSRKSDDRRKLLISEKQDKKEKEKARIGAASESIKSEIISSGGAVISNQSPHSSDVENEHAVFARMKTRFA